MLSVLLDYGGTKQIPYIGPNLLRKIANDLENIDKNPVYFCEGTDLKMQRSIKLRLKWTWEYQINVIWKFCDFSFNIISCFYFFRKRKDISSVMYRKFMHNWDGAQHLSVTIFTEQKWMEKHIYLCVIVILCFMQMIYFLSAYS